MVYCSSCGTANRDGSRFCNDCGAKLPSGTSVRCPQCGTPNSPADTFCEKCGARLVPTLADDAPEPEPPAAPLKKGLSLPTKPDADASPAPADWLGQLRSTLDSSAESEPAGSPTADAAATDDQADWLARLTGYVADSGTPVSPEDTLVPQSTAAPQSAVAPQPAAEQPAEAGEVPDWLTSLGIVSDSPVAAPDEDVPEWLSQLPSSAAEPVKSSNAPDASAEPANPADWLSALRTAAPLESSTSSDEDIPEWLRSLGTGPLISSQSDQSVAAGSPRGLVRPAASNADDEDIPEWMRSLGTGPLPSATVEPATPVTAAPTEPEKSSANLTNLRAAEASIEPVPATEPAPADSLPIDQPSVPEELPDWLRNLGAADHSQRSTDELPDWLDSLGVDQTAAAETETPAEDDVPAWLRDLGASAVTQPADSSPAALSADESSDWMSSLRDTAAQPVEPTGQSTADEPPDWLQAMGLPAPEQASTPTVDETSDWMSALRATSQPAESVESMSEPAADETPDWLQAVGLPKADQAQTPAPATDENSDWMSALRATSQSADSVESTSEPAADETPDWLQAVGLPASEQAPTPAVDETSDWMSALRATSQSVESAEVTSEPAADEVPDWLQAAGLPASEQASAPAADETPDWMSALRATSQPAESVELTSEPAADEVPDWLQAMGLPAPEQAPAPTVDESSDWMSALRATSQPTESAEPISEPAADEVPDWLQAMGLPASEQASAPAADETPDWMSALRATAQPAESVEPTSEPAADEVPDWLQAVGLPASEQAPAPAVDETSDWMSALRVTSQPTESAEVTSEPVADEVPDWLQAMGQAVPEQASTPIADETPDWMSSVRDAVTQPAEPSSEPAADEVPDWLRNFEGPTAQSVAAESPSSPSAADDIPDWLRDVGASATEQPAQPESSELPDWLQTTSTVAAEQEPASAIEPAAELPDWLSNLQPTASVASVENEPAQAEPAPESTLVASRAETGSDRVEEQPISQAIAPAELPEWLKSLREGKPAAPVQPVESTLSVPGLIQAEIPSWLEALRPKEGQTTSVADLAAESEEEGVFAGLANVLPPFPGVAQATAQAASGITGPSANDLAGAGIFQELLTRPISRPTAVVALTTSGKSVQRRVLQWVIASLLMALVVLPFLMPQGWLPLLPHADNLPPSPLVQTAVTKISVLPPNASVLVVFDYDPTQAGEMNQIAEMLLRHLQTRAANITAVSLNPLGAGLARSVWDVIGAPAGGQRIDKGYVPGQAIGVQNVLLNEGPFDLVIDLSASSDSLRWWVEQLTVSGFNMPFIAGVSAAVESLALPYAQSGQITGLISGATGAMMYARQANLLPSLDEARLERNQYHIESQTLAHWLLAILIIVGLVSGLVSRAGRRSAP